MKNERLRAASVGLVAVVMLTAAGGCDWSSGGGADGYNTSRIRSSVAGVYRASGGGPLVRDFETDNGSSSYEVKNENVATGNGSSTVFSGRLANNGVLANTLLITGGGYSFTDNGEGVLIGSPAGSGSVTYSTGAYSLDFAGTAPASGAPIRANYAYQPNAQSTAKSGASATTIYSFNVQQTGDRIRIIDNNGDAYEGRLGSTQVNQVIATGENQESIQGSIQFEANGNSRGIPIKIAGTFNVVETVLYERATTIEVNGESGTLSDGQEEYARFSGLTMEGTWIEPRAQGNISGTGPQNQRVVTTGN